MIYSRTVAVFVFAAIVATLPAAHAQVPNEKLSPTVPEIVPPKTEPDVSVPDRPCAPDPSNPTLSGQLAECGGVLQPPAGTDPNIVAPAPDPYPGTTPVIPPGNIRPQQSDK